jgi:hypothetical protein
VPPPDLGPPLSWAPPAGWESYRAINLTNANSGFYSGSGATDHVRLVWPDEPITKRQQFANVGNIVSMGGRFALTQNIIHVYLNGVAWSRIVHIEGMHILGNGGAESFQQDGVYADDCPLTEFRFQNCRYENLHGTTAGDHADCIQLNDSAKILLDRFTGSTDYQGMFLGDGVHGEIVLRNTNFFIWRVPDTDSDGFQFLFIHRNNQAADAPDVTFDEVYLKPRSDKTLQQSMYPDNTSTPSTVVSGGQITFPNHSGWSGVVKAAPPPGGDFATLDGNVGRGTAIYQSPGYA